MKRLMILLIACLLGLPASPTASAPRRAVKSGTLEKSCVGLDQLKLCFSDQESDDLLLRFAGKETSILSVGPEAGLPYEIEQRQGAYRRSCHRSERSTSASDACDIIRRRAGSRSREGDAP